MAKLDREYEFYKGNKESLLPKYEGKFIVIVGEKVVGSFDTREEAIDEAVKDHKPGTFLIHKVCKEEEVIYFRSRVAIGVD